MIMVAILGLYTGIVLALLGVAGLIEGVIW